MKTKVALWIVVCLLISLLSGCGVPGKEPAPENEHAQNTSEQPEDITAVSRGEPVPPEEKDGGLQKPDVSAAGPAAGGDAEPLSMLHCAAEGGYYYLTRDTGTLIDGRDGQHLMYIDYASRKEIYLCGDPSCPHNTADCTSVLPVDDFKGASLFAMDGKVYILVKEPDMDGSVAMGLGGGAASLESTPAVLYALNADGTGREKIYTFEENLTVEDFAVGDGGGIWFITKKVSTDEGGGNTWFTSTDRKLVRLDLADSELSTVCDMDFGDCVDWDVAGCFGRELILSGTDFGRDVSRQDKEDRSVYDSSFDVFAALDVDSGSLREIYRVKSPKARGWVLDENNLYYSAVGGGTITAISLGTCEERVVCETPHDQIWGIAGDRLYVWDYDDRAYYFIDVASGEISRCGLLNKTVGINIQIVAEAGDQVLVIYDCDADIKSDGSYSTKRNYYGLISKDDLYAGREHYLPIEMVEAGI